MRPLSFPHEEANDLEFDKNCFQVEKTSSILKFVSAKKHRKTVRFLPETSAL